MNAEKITMIPTEQVFKNIAAILDESDYLKKETPRLGVSTYIL
jgi:hypothetical protein